MATEQKGLEGAGKGSKEVIPPVGRWFKGVGKDSVLPGVHTWEKGWKE